MIVLMAGLPGTGKSTLSREVAARVHGVVLDKDRVRAALFPPGDIEYSAEQDNFCVGVMLSAARFLLRKNPARYIFLDGRTFSRRYHVESVVHAAEEIGTPWRILECVCSEQTACDRLDADAASGSHPAKNRNFELYLAVQRSFETIDLPKTVIDTDEKLESCVERALRALGSLGI